MRSVAVMTGLAFAAKANRANGTPDSTDISITRFADKLFNRVENVLLLQHADLDDTTIEKPRQAELPDGYDPSVADNFATGVNQFVSERNTKRSREKEAEEAERKASGRERSARSRSRERMRKEANEEYQKNRNDARMKLSAFVEEALHKEAVENAIRSTIPDTNENRVKYALGEFDEYFKKAREAHPYQPVDTSLNHLITARDKTTPAPAMKADAVPQRGDLSPVGSRREISLRSRAKMPMIGLGTWESPPGEVGMAVQAALSAGYRHIDCAAIYKNEPEVGAAIEASNVSRSDIWITSKLWNDNRKPADVRAGLDQTLKDLRTEYLDLYLIHWPVVWIHGTRGEPDSEASLKEAWQTLEQLVHEGKIKNIGISNYNTKEIEKLLSYARVLPAVNQIELHPRLPQKQLVQYCKSKGIQVTAYSPLGRGSIKDAGMLENERVQQIASHHSVSPASVLLRWNIQRNIIVIPKSVTPTRVAENLRQPWTFRLTADEVKALDSLEDGQRFCVPSWLPPGVAFEDHKA